MTKPDDSSLTPEELQAVEERAHLLLDRAAAWDQFPAPTNDILAAANVRLAKKSIFDPNAIIEYAVGKAAAAGVRIKKALSSVWGLYDAAEEVIHIDESVHESKQTFLTFHETGHHEIPAHKKLFRFFQDCEQTLTPEIADLFEREANNFARCVLFKGRTFAEYAADCKFNIWTPINLAKKFGASLYASAREFARTNHRACVVFVLEPIEYAGGHGAFARLRRIEPSPTFRAQFGKPNETVITLDHVLGPVLPVGRKVTRPMALSLPDKNGVAHECVAEAFDTTYNVIILLYPVKALTAKSIIVPSGLGTHNAV